MTTTTTEAPPTGALDAAAIAELRAAARTKAHNLRFALVADWRSDRGYAVTLIETREMPEGYEPRSVDRRYLIPAAGSIERYRRADVERFVASSSSYYGSATDALHVLANVARPGDVLTVRFLIGNDNDYMKNAGLTHDSCDVGLIRGVRCVAFVRLADAVVGRDSLATMADSYYRPERDGAGL